MRNLFLALVLANLAFAAWHAWFARAPRPTRAADPDLPTLTLVSEVPPDLRTGGVVSETDGALREAVAAAPAPAPAEVAPPPVLPDAAAVEAVAAETTTPVARCTSVGPFRELSQAATAAAALRAAGHEPEQRIAEGDIWIGYWVYIEAIPTEAEANEILAKVRAEGISDSYVIPNSDSGNLVSLGVFSEIGGVSLRRDQVRELGYEPQVVDRTRRATVYWVDVELAPDQALDFDALQTPGRIIRLEQRDCA